MPAYSVRSIIRWSDRPEQTKRFIYEERITGWNASSIDDAIESAELEAGRYAAKEGFEALGLFQAYWLFDSMERIENGTELFSLIRESDLEPSEYLDTYFDTGDERQSGWSH